MPSISKLEREREVTAEVYGIITSVRQCVMLIQVEGEKIASIEQLKSFNHSISNHFRVRLFKLAFTCENLASQQFQSKRKDLQFP